MRARPLAAATVAAFTAAVSLALGGTAHAEGGTCTAAGDTPHLVLGSLGIHAEGAFACDLADTGMTVTVCIQEEDGEGGWWTRGCATTPSPENVPAEPEPENLVTGEVVIDMMVYSTLLRTTVTGVNDRGETAYYESPPAFWFNCACMI